MTTKPEDAAADLFDEAIREMAAKSGAFLDVTSIYRRSNMRANLRNALRQLDIVAQSGIESLAFQQTKADALRAAREAPPDARGSGSPAVDVALEIAAIEARARRGGDPFPAAPRAQQEADGENTESPPLVNQRITAIIETATRLGYDLKQIVWGGKSAIKSECTSNTPQLFTPATFSKAWQAARKAGLIDVENSEIYKGR